MVFPAKLLDFVWTIIIYLWWKLTDLSLNFHSVVFISFCWFKRKISCFFSVESKYFSWVSFAMKIYLIRLVKNWIGCVSIRHFLILNQVPSKHVHICGTFVQPFFPKNVLKKYLFGIKTNCVVVVGFVFVLRVS